MDETKGEAEFSNQYTWNGVIEFLVGQVKVNQKKEAEWQLEKQEFQQRLAVLDGQLLSHKTLNEDLMRRIKMLEFALRQERKEANLAQYKGTEGNQEKRFFAEDETGKLLNENLFEERLQALEVLPKRRAQAHKEFLEKFMKEINCEEIYQKVLESQEQFKTTSESLATALAPIEGMNSTQAISSAFETNSQSSCMNLNPSIQSVDHEVPTFKGSVIQKTNKEREKGVLESLSTRKPVKSINPLISSTIRGHLDGVRGLYFSENYQFLVTTGEDSVTKIFDVIPLLDSEAHEDLVEPLTVFRESQASLLTMSGYSDPNFPNKSELIFAAGLEGILQVWQLKLSQSGLPLVTSLTNFQDDSMVLHQDAIWSIQAHPNDTSLLSSGADGFIHFWTYEVDSGSSEFNITNLEKPGTFNLASKGQSSTVVSWVPSKKDIFLAGVHDSDRIRLYSLGKEAQVAEFSGSHSPRSQFDAILPTVSGNTFWAGDETGTICLFDIRTKKTNQKKKIGASPISCMAFTPDEKFLAVGCHNGLMKVIEVSKHEEVASLKVHNSKYDEGVHSILSLGQYGKIVTGGADGLVRVVSL